MQTVKFSRDFTFPYYLFVAALSGYQYSHSTLVLSSQSVKNIILVFVKNGVVILFPLQVVFFKIEAINYQ